MEKASEKGGILRYSHPQLVMLPIEAPVTELFSAPEMFEKHGRKCI